MYKITYLNASFSSSKFLTSLYEERIFSLQNVIICIKSGTSNPNLDICSDSRITSTIKRSKFKQYLFVFGWRTSNGADKANRT